MRELDAQDTFLATDPDLKFLLTLSDTPIILKKPLSHATVKSVYSANS